MGKKSTAARAKQIEVAAEKEYRQDRAGLAAAIDERWRAHGMLSNLRLTLEARRGRPGFSLETERLVLEAIHVAKGRGLDDELREIEKVCRRILDRSWAPTMVRDGEAGSWPASIPSTLRPKEAHQLFGVVVDACASSDDANAHGELIVTLQRFPEHFGRRAEDVDDDVVRAVVRALRESRSRGENPTRRVLAAWGLPDSRIKHVQRSLRRGQKT